MLFISNNREITYLSNIFFYSSNFGIVYWRLMTHCSTEHIHCSGSPNSVITSSLRRRINSSSLLRDYELACPSWVFGWVRVAYLFSFLCCPNMCSYVLSSVLWCPLWFPHINDVGSSLPLVVCSVLSTLVVFVYI